MSKAILTYKSGRTEIRPLTNYYGATYRVRGARDTDGSRPRYIKISDSGNGVPSTNGDYKNEVWYLGDRLWDRRKNG